MARFLFLLNLLGAVASAWTGPRVLIGMSPVRNDAMGGSGFAEQTRYPGGALVVFEDLRESDITSSISAVRYDDSGSRLDPSGIRIAAQPGNHWNPDAACIGTSCLVVWERAGVDVAAVRFDAASGTVQGAVFSVMVGALPAVASNGTDFVVVASRATGIFSRVVSAAGVPQGTSTSVGAGYGPHDNPQLLLGPSGFLMAWYEFNSGAIRSRMLDFSGAPTAAVRTHTTSAAPYVDSPLSGLWDGTRYALAWSGGQAVFMQRLTSAGALIDASPVQVITTAGVVFGVALANEGSNYTLAFAEPQPMDVWLTRVDPSTLLTVSNTIRAASLALGRVVTTSFANGTGLLLVERFTGPPEVLTHAFTYQPLADAGIAVSPLGYLVQGNAAEHQPRGTWTGAEYVVGWWGGGTSEGVARMRRLSPLGVPVAPIRDLSDGGMVSFNVGLGYDGQQLNALWHEGPPTDALGGGIWWQPFDGAGAALRNQTRLVVNLRGEAAPTMATVGETTIAGWGGDVYGSGPVSQVTRLPMDGGVPSSPTNLPAGVDISTGIVGASGTQTLACWAESSSYDIRWSRLSPTLALIDTPGTQSSSFPKNLSMGSNGEDFLVAYAEGYQTESIRALRVSQSGARLGTGTLQVAPSNSDQQGGSLSTSVAFDGQAYRVAYEVPSDAGVQVWWRRVWPDGGMEPPQMLIDAGYAEKPWLVQGSPGRILVLWEQWDEATLARRVLAMPWAEVAPGDPCTISAECNQGTCTSGLCCDFDAGPCDVGTPLADGGTPGSSDAGSLGDPMGNPSQEDEGLYGQAFRVSCGCGSSSPSGNLWGGVVLALFFLFSRRP